VASNTSDCAALQKRQGTRARIESRSRRSNQSVAKNCPVLYTKRLSHNRGIYIHRGRVPSPPPLLILSPSLVISLPTRLWTVWSCTSCIIIFISFLLMHYMLACVHHARRQPPSVVLGLNCCIRCRKICIQWPKLTKQITQFKFYILNISCNVTTHKTTLLECAKTIRLQINYPKCRKLKF